MPEEKLSNVEEAIVLGLCHKYAQQNPPHMPEKREKSRAGSVFMLILGICAGIGVGWITSEYMTSSRIGEFCKEVRQVENEKTAQELNYCLESLKGEKSNVDLLTKWASDNFWSFRNLKK